MRLLFLDIETTGGKIDELCQVAYKIGEEEFSGLFKPANEVITFGAMAVSHITNDMVADKQYFKESDMYKELDTLFKSEDTVLVAHNAPFDVDKLVKEGLTPPNVICTLKLAQYLDTEGVVQSYSLQYLRYYLGLDTSLDEGVDIQAHDALGDVLILEQLFDRLYSALHNKVFTNGHDSTVDGVHKEMIEITSKPLLLPKIQFGKYKGQAFSDIVKNDRQYLEWLHGQKATEDQPNEDMLYTLKYHLGIPTKYD